MERYNPKQAPDPDVWLALDEDERTFMVESYHDSEGEEVPEGGSTLHATFHVIVENQVALGTDLVKETIAKLTRQGLGRHEAIHAGLRRLRQALQNLSTKQNCDQRTHVTYRRSYEPKGNTLRH